jgi:hypothetical protein
LLRAGRAITNSIPLCHAVRIVPSSRRLTEDDLRCLAPGKLDAIRHVAR